MDCEKLTVIVTKIIKSVLECNEDLIQLELFSSSDEFMSTEARFAVTSQGIVMYFWDCIPEDGQVVFVIIFGGLCYLLLFLSKHFAR